MEENIKIWGKSLCIQNINQTLLQGLNIFTSHLSFLRNFLQKRVPPTWGSKPQKKKKKRAWIQQIRESKESPGWWWREIPGQQLCRKDRDQPGQMGPERACSRRISKDRKKLMATWGVCIERDLPFWYGVRDRLIGTRKMKRWLLIPGKAKSCERKKM